MKYHGRRSIGLGFIHLDRTGTIDIYPVVPVSEQKMSANLPDWRRDDLGIIFLVQPWWSDFPNATCWQVIDEIVKRKAPLISAAQLSYSNGFVVRFRKGISSYDEFYEWDKPIKVQL